MHWSSRIVVTSLTCTLFAVQAYADEAAAAAPEPVQCRDIANAEDRLQCYDRQEAVVEAEAEAPVSNDVQEQPSQRQASSDDMGTTDEDNATNSVRVAIDRCGEASNRMFYFYLENGEVWKYLGSKNLRYRDCKLGATIVPDGLGHYLRVDGETRKLRVMRLK